MTKSGYPYPPDEFDVAVPGGAPVGVHRAPRSGWSSAWPFLLVAVVCAAVAWGGITLLSGDGDPAEASGDPSTSASAPASPSGEPSASGEPSVEPSGEPSAETGGAADPAALKAGADLTAQVAVYNVGQEAGLAGETAEYLTGQDVAGAALREEPQTPDGATYTENTVLYGANRAETAAYIAALLGIPEANMVESAAVSDSPEAVWVAVVTRPATMG